MDRQAATAFLLQKINQELEPDAWSVTEKEDQIQVMHKSLEGVGFQLSISSVLAKMEQGKEEAYLTEAVRKMKEMAYASTQVKQVKGFEDQVYPIIRSASFPREKQGVPLLNREHTAESHIFYALDLGRTYVVIDRKMAEESGYRDEEIHQMAITNLKKLDTSFKEDEVAGNRFYFFSQRDGYAASRILNDELLAFMRRKMTKDMGIAIPHQDVLIMADIQNETGYKALSRINMDFCMKGDIPISPLPFLYANNELEPIMVMAAPGAAPSIVRKKGE
ncbi:DUF1444 family protein [Ammoniphilus sp. YIM 78166]|uniref:DUF1444 family protein n=1 Tax=Ammoniphilus sp. YIM 78166 TaxID=1644106 RepID=UPI00106F1CFD|nr:DUF1444 family protein [Ammoniphilus sp. YIM 78166]